MRTLVLHRATLKGLLDPGQFVNEISAMRPQRSIQRRCSRIIPERRDAGYAIFRDAAGHDAAKVRQIRVEIDREAVERDPATDPDPDRSDLGLVGSLADPDPDSAGCAVGGNPEITERGDHPTFDRADEAADIAPAPVEVEHQIDHPLAGPNAQPAIGDTSRRPD